MLTVDEFRHILAKKEGRKAGSYSRSYIFQLINAKRITPAPEKIGKGRGVYIIEDNARISK